MTEDDLLGSFFSEINSVAAAGEGPVTETKIASPVSEPVVAVQAVAVAAVSHPVYNYSEAVVMFCFACKSIICQFLVKLCCRLATQRK